MPWSRLAFDFMIFHGKRMPSGCEAHLRLCIWEHRQVSDWVVAIHSFEEYLHSVELGPKVSPLANWLDRWALDVPRLAVFELFQEPMGGPRQEARSTVGAWTSKRGVAMSDDVNEMSRHFRAFTWIVDPLNVVQSMVHFAQPRADGQGIMALHKDLLRVNHYVDFGSNKSRCFKELGGCNIPDTSLTWAEEKIIAMRSA